MLLMLDDLDRIEEAMVWVHELCHMWLHPPGTAGGASVDHRDAPEEGLVHHAAAVVCAHFGVTGYRRRMLGHGVPLALFPDSLPRGRTSERDRLAADVRAALLSPEVLPSWSGRNTADLTKPSSAGGHHPAKHSLADNSDDHP